MIYIVDFSYVMKKYIATGYKYPQKVGEFTYDAGWVVLLNQGLTKLYQGYPDAKVFYCLDGTPLRHRQLLPSYKTHRKFDPGYYPISAFLPKLRKKFPQVQVLFLPGEEADTVAASLVYLLRGRVTPADMIIGDLNDFAIDQDPRVVENIGSMTYDRLSSIPVEEEIILCTSDADWYQLLTLPEVFVDHSLTGIKIDRTRETPKIVDNVLPCQITAYKSLKGDHSDNLPGVKLKGFNLLKYVRSIEREDQFEENFSKTGEETELVKLLGNQYNQVYTNYLLAKLDFVCVPYVLK
jgi:hypothetical protein